MGEILHAAFGSIDDLTKKQVLFIGFSVTHILILNVCAGIEQWDPWAEDVSKEYFVSIHSRSCPSGFLGFILKTLN
jgi:hypothetical protein